MPFTFTHLAKSICGTSLKQPYDKSKKKIAPALTIFKSFQIVPGGDAVGSSTVFGRLGFHGKVFPYFLCGMGTFLATMVQFFETGTIKAQTFSPLSLSLSVKVLTFTLSSSIGILVVNYWTNSKYVEKETKIIISISNISSSLYKLIYMNYGLSNAVDTIATTIGYNHPNAHVLLGSVPWMLLDNTELSLLPRHPSIKNPKKKSSICLMDTIWTVHICSNPSQQNRSCIHYGWKFYRKFQKNGTVRHRLVYSIIYVQ